MVNGMPKRVPSIWKTERVGGSNNCLVDVPVKDWVEGLCFDTGCTTPNGDGDGNLGLNKENEPEQHHSSK
jgi:hypothetical protein